MSTRVATALLIGLAVAGWLAWAAGPATASEDAALPGSTPGAAEQPAPEGAATSASEGATEGLSGGATEGAHESAGEEAEQVGLNPLDFQKDLAIWTAIIFLLLLAVLWLFAWGPITSGLRRREQRIADEIAGAERSNAEARQLLEQYEQRLAASGEQVHEMLQAARRDAEQVGHQIVEKARADAEAEHQRALREIDRATADAIKELADQSATLAVELAGKIVQAKLDPQAHAHLIAQAVSDFAKHEPGKN